MIFKISYLDQMLNKTLLGFAYPERFDRKDVYYLAERKDSDYGLCINFKYRLKEAFPNPDRDISEVEDD